MNSFLDLRVQVHLFHESVNHSPLPWAGISYTVSMSLPDKIAACFRKDWLNDVEHAALSAVVSYYRRGVMKPTCIRLFLPYEGKAKILGIASHGPQTAPLWRRLRRLTPSGKRHEVLTLKSHTPSKSSVRNTNANQLKTASTAMPPTCRS